MQDDDYIYKVLSVIGLIFVIWLALLVAPLINGGLVEIIQELPNSLNNPFKIQLCENSLKTVLAFSIIYILGIALYVTNKKNYRRGEEHGSAKWGNKREIDKRYRKKPDNDNKILTQNVAIGLDGKLHRRNLNVLVCGGSRSR